MTATRPTTPPEPDPTGPGQESQERGNPRKRKDKKPQNRTADKADEIRI